MPRDKSENHEKIVAAALCEFLEYGFREASMRRIATACGMSASGLYKHFPSKEDMFAALTDPAVNGFFELYHKIETEYNTGLEADVPEIRWEQQQGVPRVMMYIYDHLDEFKLIICKAQGTRYENFTHDVSELEEKVTLNYMEKLREKGEKLNEVDPKEFHLLVTASTEAIFQAVIHDFSREEALHYAKTLEKFFMPAWKALFGV